MCRCRRKGLAEQVAQQVLNAALVQSRLRHACMRARQARGANSCERGAQRGRKRVACSVRHSACDSPSFIAQELNLRPHVLCASSRTASAALDGPGRAGVLLVRSRTRPEVADALHACCCNIISSPRIQGPALSLVLGVAGCNSRAGLVRLTLAQAGYELGHGGNERVRLAL